MAPKSEIALTALPTSHLTLEANFAFLHARYGNYIGVSGVVAGTVDFGGHTLDNAPSYSPRGRGISLELAARYIRAPE